MFLNKKTMRFIKDSLSEMEQLKYSIQDADAVVIGAGAGISISAGFV